MWSRNGNVEMLWLNLDIKTDLSVWIALPPIANPGKDCSSVKVADSTGNHSLDLFASKDNRIMQCRCEGLLPGTYCRRISFA